MNQWGRHITLGLLLAGLLLLTYRVLENFLKPVGWALILASVTWPLYGRLKRLLNDNSMHSAMLMTLFISAVLVIPLIWVMLLFQTEAAQFFRDLPAWLEQKPSLPAFVQRIPYLGPELQSVVSQFEDLQALVSERGTPWLKGFSKELLRMLEGIGYNVVKLLFTLLTVFFIYRDGPQAVREVRQVLQTVLGERFNAYLSTAEATVRAVVYGIVLTAIAQGTLAGIGYWVVGIRAPLLLSVVTMFFSMIPFGTPVVWGGASLWLLLHGDHWAGISLFLWGVLVVSWMDNLIRPLVISSSMRIPFIWIMFGVLGGLTSFGFIGLFVGPVILAISFAVWREWLHPHQGIEGTSLSVEGHEGRGG